jgi:tetratricopeptide (TPR) repeat protein
LSERAATAAGAGRASRGGRALLLLALGLLAGLRAAAAADVPAALARIEALRLAWRGSEAIAIVDSLLPAARAARDSSLLVALLIRQGELRTSLGDAAGARAPLEEAMALAVARDDWAAQRSALRWLGLAWEGLGEAPTARRLYLELQSKAAAAGDAKHQGWAQVGLAWQDYLAGQTAQSADRYRQAIAHFAATDERRGEIWAWNGLGASLSGLGDYRGAMDCYRRAAAGARASSDPTVEAMALNNLGLLAMDLGDPGDAIAHFDRARGLEIEEGYPKGAFLPALNSAKCWQGLGRLDAASAMLDSLLAASRAADWPDLEAHALLASASLALERGRPRRAVGIYREGLALGPRLPARSALELRLGLARALGRCEGDQAALAALEASSLEAAGIEDRRLALEIAAERGRRLLALGRAPEARRRFRAAAGEAAALGLSGIRVEALAGLAAAERALGHADSALVLLREGARVWEAERSLPRDPEWREQRGASGHLLYSDLALALLAPRDGLGEEERRHEAFDQLQRFKARTLQERMLGPGEPAQGAGWATASLERLQQGTLREGELLLDLYLGPERSLLFAVTRERCHALVLPAEGLILGRLRALHALLATPPAPERGAAQAAADRAVIAAAAAALRSQLFGGVEDLLAASRRAILVPDGPLNLLAPALLDAGGGREWMRVPAAAVLVQLREAEAGASPPSPPRALALAGGEGGLALPGARRELEALTRSYAGVTALQLDGAGAAPLAMDRLRGYALLHFATHAELDDQSPWQSALLLGDTRFTAAEIARERLDARLAVLAACASADGRRLSGEGVLGLASAFLSAGAPAVVATLWPVDDAATAQLMERFYAGLAAGRSAAAALAEAQAGLRAEPATAHPFFWAGVVLVGDGEAGLPLQRRPLLARHGAQILAGLAAALLLTAALHPARKKTRHL